MSGLQILLAVRNGVRWLPELLDSLLAQSDQGFTVLARDDGSTDGTRDLLTAWAARHPGRLELLADHTPSGSASGNFQRLLAASAAPWVLPCDQDDVWLPDKIARFRAAIGDLERRHGADVPLLLHADLEIVDAGLRTIHPSMWAYQKLDPGLAGVFHRVMVQHVVTGCAMAVNRPLLDLALPVPPQAIMHDWWLAMAAAALGVAGVIPHPVVRYRQHGANDTGAKRFDLAYVARKAALFLDRRDLTANLARTQKQAQAFLDRFGPRMSAADRRSARVWAALPGRSWLGRRCAVVRHRLFKIGLVRNLGMLARI